MCLIPHTSAYRPKSKLLKTDGDRPTMLRMGPIHPRDNGQGVSGTGPERTARYRDLLYSRTGIGCHHSYRNRPRGFGTTGRQGSKDASIPHGNTWWPPGRIQVCGRATVLDIINMETISVLISFSHPGVSYLIITICPVIVFTEYSQ